MKDKVFGVLNYDDSWVRDLSINFFSKEQKVELIVEGYEDEEISDYQRNSFNLFSSKTIEFVTTVEKAIFDHYVEVCSEYREKFGVERADDWAPVVFEICDMKRLVSLKEIYFPENMDDESNSMFGFLLSCSWEPELGLAVKILDGIVDEIGPQDIIL